MNEEYGIEESNCYLDCRREQMGPIESPPSVDISSALMVKRIAGIHNRLLQQATRGLLRWRDDDIVPAADGRNLTHITLPQTTSPTESETPTLIPIYQAALAHHTTDLHPVNLESTNSLGLQSNTDATLEIERQLETHALILN